MKENTCFDQLKHYVEPPTKKMMKKGGVNELWNVPGNEVRNNGWKDEWLLPQLLNMLGKEDERHIER